MAHDIHVVRINSLLRPFRGGAGSLQEFVTDRDGVGQRRRVTSHTGPFGPLGLGGQPLHAHPGDYRCLAGVFNRVGASQRPLDGRPRSVQVALPGGQFGLVGGDVGVEEGVYAGEGSKLAQALGGNRASPGDLDREPKGGPKSNREGRYQLGNGASQLLALVPVTCPVADCDLSPTHADPEPGPAAAGLFGQLGPFVK